MHGGREIREALSLALFVLGIDHDTAAIPLEFPADFAHGDFASSVALVHAKSTGMNPRELAEKITGELSKTEIGSVERIEVAGPGFINFTLKAEIFSDVVTAINSEPGLWGRHDKYAGKRIMVEFTDPNPFKEFHIGHLMSNAIGESISRLLEFSGATVIRANYQGDVGPHVAKAIWALEKFKLDPSDVSQLGKAYKEGAAAYENDTTAKEEIDAINKQVYEKNNPVVNELYAEGRKTSLAHFEELYALLGTTFDHYFFESDSAPRGMRLIEENKSLFEESDGALVYRGEQHGLHTRVFVTSRGTPTYETKDLGLLEMKQEVGEIDQSITVTAHEQADYFAVMLAAAKRIKKIASIADHTRHVTHGMMRFAEGKMSSRTGNVITGESLLGELADAARERAKESRAENHDVLAKQIAVAAIKHQILRQSSGKDIIFERERALSLEGDSGPYMQYTYARTAQLLVRAINEGVRPVYSANADPSVLVRLLARFPQEVEYAASLLEPHLITTYLIEVCGAFNRWYAEERVFDDSGAMQHKIAIVGAAHATLAQGLKILGIPAPDKM